MFPAASRAVQLTVVNPGGNKDPLAGEQVVVEPGQLSCGVAANVTTAPQSEGFRGTTMSDGQEIVGNWLSVTVTVKLHIFVPPSPSVTVQTTGVVPTGNEFGLRITTLFVRHTTLVILQPSTATVGRVTSWPHSFEAALNGPMLAGHAGSRHSVSTTT